MWNAPQSRPGPGSVLAEGDKVHITKILRSDVRVDIVTRYHTENRLAKTCFRGMDIKKAGNFSQWDSVEKVLEDATVLDELLDDLNEVCRDRNIGTISLNIQHPRIVGWESTDVPEKYNLDDLEHFKLNRKARALRVKTNRTDLKAPQTNLLTLIYELKLEDGNFVVIIHSLYPGIDVGELVGNVTKRENRIFFDWNHPGEE
jgi:hypothetical protein